jgi:hypothetical protein
LIIISVGVYFIAGLGTFKEMFAASERQRLAAMATQAANETSIAVDKLSNEFRPPMFSKDVNLSRRAAPILRHFAAS